MEYSKIVEALDRILYLIERQGISCRDTQETQTHTHTHTHTQKKHLQLVLSHLSTMFT